MNKDPGVGGQLLDAARGLANAAREAIHDWNDEEFKVKVRTPRGKRTHEFDPSRRRVLIGAGATALALMAGGKLIDDRYFDDQELNDEAGSGDVLVDPNKATAFIGEYQELAESLAEDEEKPLPFEVFLAIAMHESDSGTSELAVEANNFFGVVAKDGWNGDTYLKSTEEEIAATDLPALQLEHGSDISIVGDYGDGRLRVKYPRPFRRYDSVEDSFTDFVDDKVYYQNEDGSYRYNDVVAYLSDGGRDAHLTAGLMADEDEPGEARYATGREWVSGVHRYIDLVHEVTGKKSVDEGSGEDPELPPDTERIDIESLDFSELDQPRDEELIRTIKEALSELKPSDYAEFLESGIKDRSDRVKELVQDSDYYNSHYNNTIIEPKYLVWHVWAIGVQNSGTPESGPTGRSHDINVEDIIKSWKNVGDGATCGYVLSDNEDGELWQLGPHPFSKSNHVGHGIQDQGVNTHPDVGNGNALGIEVQANSVYDLTEKQWKQLILWSTAKLFEADILRRGMIREEVDEVVNSAVIGHGKNEGVEFGYKYTRPLVQALQQYAYLAVQG